MSDLKVVKQYCSALYSFLTIARELTIAEANNQVSFRSERGSVVSAKILNLSVALLKLLLASALKRVFLHDYDSFDFE